jgi:Flp pilus assembly protein TadD
LVTPSSLFSVKESPVRDPESAETKSFPRTLAKWLAVGALVSATGGCAALPALEVGGAILSGFANFDAFRDKIAALFNPSDKTAEQASPSQLMADGDIARDRGDSSSAAWYYAQAAAADPKSKAAQLRLGAAELSLNNDAGAYVAYRAALSLDAKDSEAALRLGEIELARSDAPAALNHLSLALRTQQKDPKLYNAMGVAFTMEGKYDLARQSFDAGLTLKPGYPALLNNYGLMQLQSGDMQAALHTFSALVASSYDSERYRTNRALVEIALGNTTAALRDAPTMDEAGLRQMLTRYVPAEDSTKTATDIHLQATPSEAAQQAGLPSAGHEVRIPLPPPAQVSENTWHQLRGVY